MSRLAGALRLPGAPDLKTHLIAAAATALLPAGLGLALLWLVPAGCDIRGAQGVYLWTCLLPGLLITVAPAAAILLPPVFMLNARYGRPLPDGWLIVVPAAGIVTHALLAGVYLLILDAAYRQLFFVEAFSVPQPFVAGALAGAVYWMALRAQIRHLPRNGEAEKIQR